MRLLMVLPWRNHGVGWQKIGMTGCYMVVPPRTSSDMYAPSGKPVLVGAFLVFTGRGY